MSEAQHKQDLSNNKRRRLQVLEQQAARYGIDCPAHITLEIEELRKELELLGDQQGDALTIRSTTAPLPIPPTFAHAQPPEMFWSNRKREIETLIKLWQGQKVRIVGLIGLVGIGKSSVARKWHDKVYQQSNTPDGFFWWSFYYQPNLDEFLVSILRYLTGGMFRDQDILSPWVRIQQLITLLNSGRFAIVLDGLEAMQNSHESGDDFGRLEDRAFRNLLELCADPDRHKSFIIITSRFPLTDLQNLEGHSYRGLIIDHFSEEDGAKYLKRRRIKGRSSDLLSLSREYDGHALSLSLLAGYLNEYFEGHFHEAYSIPFLSTDESTKVYRLLKAYSDRLSAHQKSFMQLISAIRRPANHKSLESIIYENATGGNALIDSLKSLSRIELRKMIRNLEKRGLLSHEEDKSGDLYYSTHLIIREHFYNQIKEDPDLQKQINLYLRDFAARQPTTPLPDRLEDLMPLFDMVFYSCRAGLFDEAVQIYPDRMTLGQWKLGFRFGAYEFQISFLREFFPDRDLSNRPLVTNPKAGPFLMSEIAYCLKRLGRISEARGFYKRGAEIALESSDYESAAIGYQGLAETNLDLGKLSEAYSSAMIALEFSKLSEAKLWECNSLANMARIAFLKGDTTAAEELYQKANLLQWSDNPEELGLFSILGVQYAEFLLMTGRLGESLRNTERNLDICKNRNWIESIAYCERLLGDIHFSNKNYSSAITHYTKSLEITRNFGMQEELSRSLLGVGKLLISEHKFDEALFNIRSALEISTRSMFLLVEVDIRISWALLEISRNDFPEADIQARKALSISDSAQYAWGKGKALHLLGEGAVYLQKWDEAIQLLQDAYTVRSQILDPNAYLTEQLILQIKQK